MDYVKVKYRGVFMEDMEIEDLCRLVVALLSDKSALKNKIKIMEVEARNSKSSGTPDFFDLFGIKK